MANEKTRVDALRFFHTGAASHEAAQTDADLSLGKYLSSTEILPLVVEEISSPIANIGVNLIGIENGTGDGTLTATGVDDVKWTPPGGTIGNAVTILNGETKIVEGGGATGPNEFIRITRTSATDLTGTATVTIAYDLNNVYGFDDVTSSEGSSGDDEYRCVGMKNVSSAQVQNIKLTIATLGTQRTSDSVQLGASGSGYITTTGSFADWPDVGCALITESGGSVRELVYYESRSDTTLTVPAAGRGLGETSASAGAADDTVDAVPGAEIGTDAPSSQPNGTFVDNTGSGEGTAPAGVTVSTPIVDGDALDCGDLDASEIFSYWIHRIVIVGAVAGLNMRIVVKVKFDSA